MLRLGILKEKDSKLTASSEVLQILLSFLDLPTTIVLFRALKCNFCLGFIAAQNLGETG